MPHVRQSLLSRILYLQVVTPDGKKFLWANLHRIVEKRGRTGKKGGVTVGDTLERGDTLVKGIKSDSDSDSDEQKKVARFFRKQWRGDTLSYRPGCHPP